MCLYFYLEGVDDLTEIQKNNNFDKRTFHQPFMNFHVYCGNRWSHHFHSNKNVVYAWNGNFHFSPQTYIFLFTSIGNCSIASSKSRKRCWACLKTLSIARNPFFPVLSFPLFVNPVVCYFVSQCKWSEIALPPRLPILYKSTLCIIYT